MADTADDLAQSAVLIHEIGQLRYGVFIGLGVIVTLAMGIVALWLILRHREKTREQASAEAQETAKDVRASRHAHALDSLAGTIREHIIAGAEGMTHIQTALGSFGAGVASIESTMHTLHRQIDHVLDRQDGKLTTEQSLAMIESFFFSVVVEKAFGLIALSLLQNNYEQRKAFIQERIKTDVSRVLYDVRASLKSLPLSIRTEFFFTRTEQDGERFLYCDSLWDAVQPLYLAHNTPIGERINELRYKVLNTTKDYFEDCRPLACSSDTHLIKKPQSEPYKKHPSSASIRPL